MISKNNAQRVGLLAAVTIAMGCGMSAPAGAQDQWESQVRQLLSKASQTIESRGYVGTDVVRVGALNAGASTRVSIHLPARTAVVIGVCDNDCSDVDLQLYDSDGRLVGQDVETDDVPIVVSNSTTAGDYTLTVKMIKCNAGPCRWGAQLYVK